MMGRRAHRRPGRRWRGQRMGEMAALVAPKDTVTETVPARAAPWNAPAPMTARYLGGWPPL